MADEATGALEKLGNWMPSSFWERREGKVGTAVIIAGGLGLGAVGVFGVVPLIGGIVWGIGQTVGAGVALGALVGIPAAIGLNKQSRAVAMAWFEGKMYNLADKIMDVDPIVIGRGLYEGANREVRGLFDALASHDREIEDLVRLKNLSITQGREALERGSSLIDQGQEMDARKMAFVAQLHSQEVGDFDRMLTFMVEARSSLKQVAEFYDYTVFCFGKGLDSAAVRWNKARATWNVIEEGQARARGLNTRITLLRRDLEIMERQIQQNVSLAKSAAERYKEIMAGVDSRAGVLDDTALKALKAWKAETSKLLPPAQTTKLVTKNADGTLTLDLEGSRPRSAQEIAQVQENPFAKVLLEIDPTSSTAKPAEATLRLTAQ